MQITEVLTTSKIIVKTLQKLSVDAVFGYPGRAVLGIYDELSKQNDIKHYLLRHEQSAVHAAEGYARISGKCGFVIVTSGPGASNTVTGLVNAYLDGFPVVVISGQVDSRLSGKNSFQEINFTEMVKSCTKAAFKIERAAELESTLLQAYLIAMSGKKGPVVIDIPQNILLEETEYKNLALPSDKTGEVSSLDVIRVLEVLNSSKSPLIVCGGGVLQAKASKELLQLVNRTNIPLVSTMMGLGAFPQIHPNYAGMIGIFGDKAANELLLNSDTLLVFGARFNDRITDAFNSKELNSKTIVQVDINSKELILNLSSDIPLNIDIKGFLKALLNNLPESLHFEYSPAQISTERVVEENLTAAKIMKALYTFTNDFAPVIAAEVGQHQISLVKNYKFNSPGKLLVSGGLGTMGFGFPAAIGASIANGKKQPVVLVTGDGSFQMNLSELAVCKENNLPVKILVINNSGLGMVRQLQDEQFGQRHYETELTNPDFVLLAKSYGIDAVRVVREDEVIPALEKAFETESPFVIEFVTDSEEVV